MSPSPAEQAIVSTLRSRLGPDSLLAEYGMQVDDVRSADHGDGARIEVRFHRSARPNTPFVVGFRLVDIEIDPADEDPDEGTLEGALGVIWGNMLEIAALPKDYLHRGIGHGEVEVFA